jgi:hypothetical protein
MGDRSDDDDMSDYSERSAPLFNHGTQNDSDSERSYYAGSPSRSNDISAKNLAMLDDPQFSDFTFIVQSTEFKVHKNILAQASPVFRKMFTSSFEESQTNQCKVDAISPEVFQIMLRFIYGREFAGMYYEDTLKLYEAADFYELPDLMKVCKEEINNNISYFNTMTLYEWAWTYNVDELKQRIWKILKR